MIVASSVTHHLSWIGYFAVLLFVSLAMFAAGYVVRGSR